MPQLEIGRLRINAHNDNDCPPYKVTLTQLAAALAIDEDTLLRRLAKVLAEEVSETSTETSQGSDWRSLLHLARRCLGIV